MTHGSEEEILNDQVVARACWICEYSQFESCTLISVWYILLGFNGKVELFRLIWCSSCTKSHDPRLFWFRHQKEGFFSVLLWSSRLSFSASYFFLRHLDLGICRFVASVDPDTHVSWRRATKLQSGVTIHNSSFSAGRKNH